MSSPLRHNLRPLNQRNRSPVKTAPSKKLRPSALLPQLIDKPELSPIMANLNNDEDNGGPPDTQNQGNNTGQPEMSSATLQGYLETQAQTNMSLVKMIEGLNQNIINLESNTPRQTVEVIPGGNGNNPDHPEGTPQVNIDRGSVFSTRSGRNKRSAKVPDPEKLGSHKQDKVKYEDWQVEIREKLAINADHYDNERAKMYQVWTVTEGDARQDLAPRYRHDAVEPFNSADEMITFLGTFFLDPNKVRVARRDFTLMTMELNPDTGLKYDSYQDFRTAFNRLANESSTPASIRFELFHEKLDKKLREQHVPVMLMYQHDLLGYMNHVGNSYTENAYNKRVTDEDKLKKDTKQRNPASTSFFGQVKSRGYGNKSFGPSVDKAVQIEKLATPTLNLPAGFTGPGKEKSPTPSNVKEQNCWNCGQLGHQRAQCPNAKVDIKSIAEQFNDVAAMIAAHNLGHLVDKDRGMEDVINAIEQTEEDNDQGNGGT